MATQPFAVLEFIHTVSAAYILSAFFVMGVSAYHLLKKQHVDLFTRSFRIALVLGLVFSFVEVFEGHLHASDLAEKQPTKLAAMESHWETATRAPDLSFCDSGPEKRNVFQFGSIPAS